MAVLMIWLMTGNSSFDNDELCDNKLMKTDWLKVGFEQWKGCYYLFKRLVYFITFITLTNCL
jgi:hypothetical protein